MVKDSVRDPAGALAYVTDCTLATVCNLASKRSAPKYELRRQVSIAQQAASRPAHCATCSLILGEVEYAIPV